MWSAISKEQYNNQRWIFQQGNNHSTLAPTPTSFQPYLPSVFSAQCFRVGFVFNRTTGKGKGSFLDSHKITENNSNFQTDGNSQGKGHSSLSTSNRKLLHCHIPWNHKANSGDHACFQLTNEIRSSEVGCRSQFVGKEQEAEWKVPGCVPEYGRIILRPCFWKVLSLPVTATWTTASSWHCCMC